MKNQQSAISYSPNRPTLLDILVDAVMGALFIAALLFWLVAASPAESQTGRPTVPDTGHLISEGE